MSARWSSQRPVSTFLDWLKNAWRLVSGATQSSAAGSLSRGRGSEQEWQFFNRVMREYRFDEGAIAWIQDNVNVRVDDFSTTRGGGYWQPANNEVRVFTAQHEAALHELAHSWWHYRRPGQENDMIEAVVRLSAEKDPRYTATAKLAFDYVHGIPAQNWAGMLVERNDWEMFAGLASGTMGDMSKLPPYMWRFYEGLFKLPDTSAPQV